MIDNIFNKITSLFKRDDFSKEYIDDNNLSDDYQNNEYSNNEQSPGKNKDTKKTSNDRISTKQEKFLIKLLLAVFAGIIALIVIFTAKKQEKIAASIELPKIDIAEKAIDNDVLWRNYLEGKINTVQSEVDNKLKEKTDEVTLSGKKLLDEMKLEMEKVQEQVAMAKAEMRERGLELQKAVDIQNELNAKESLPEVENTTARLLGNNLELDEPKPSKYYVPETTYVTGHVMGGFAVSTALSAPDSNTTPVVIKITDRGNLPRNFSIDIKTCKILGSSYGDLSLERAIVRLEKMVCIDPKTELIITTKVAGTLYGDDGKQGIKGKVISTGSRQLNGALVGGIISGFSQSAKGQEGFTISPVGAMASNKQTPLDMLKKGALTGAGNAAEKYADYYLKLAESTSPVLTIPTGTKVQMMFLKGFYIGEQKTHAKIANERLENKREMSQSNIENNYGNARSQEEYDRAIEKQNEPRDE